MSDLVIHGDARHLPLKDSTVQCVVTSPPYWGLRDYGVDGQLGLEPTPELYVAHLVAVFREVRRVLRDDGTLWLNLGDSYQSGSRGGYDRDRAGVGKNMGATASDFHAAPNRLPQSGLKDKDLVGIPWRVAFALQADGWYLRSDIIWAKPNPMPESVTDRPTKAHEYLFLLAKSERYFYDAEAIKERSAFPDGPNSPESIKSPYGQGFTRKAIARQNGDGYYPPNRVDSGGVGAPGQFRNRRSVWTIATEPYPEAHFATFPTELVKPCVMAGSRVGDLVLDPFAGSGTTLYVAKDLGRHAIGIDLKADYTQLARHRTRQGALTL